MSTPIVEGVRYWLDRSVGSGGAWVAPGRDPLYLQQAASTAKDWSATNLPSDAYGSEADFTADWPAVEIVDIQTGSSDFATNLRNTVNSAGGRRVVVRLGVGTYHLKSFVPTGSDPNYAFGFFTSNLQGLLGRGPDKTFIQMDANSFSTAQLDKMKTLVAGSSARPSQQAMWRIDAKPNSPICLAGFTAVAADQQLLTAVDPSLGSIFVPQPAPHLGWVLYADAPTVCESYLSYARFIGTGRAINSMPPFESANLHTGRGIQHWHHLDIDGRRAPWIDPAQPRRCGAMLLNSEYHSELEDMWVHHTNISRYAVNDQNSATISGLYSTKGTKYEQVTNNRNSDPAINGGNTLGGYTNATLMGWETTNAEVRVEDSYMSIDNPYTDGQVAGHFQFTHVGSIAQKQGGRAYFIDNTYRHTQFSQLDGFCILRIADNTYWWTDGFNTTIQVVNNGVRKSPVVVPKTVAWPPSAAWIASQGAKPDTHYLVRPA